MRTHLRSRTLGQAMSAAGACRPGCRLIRHAPTLPNGPSAESEFSLRQASAVISKFLDCFLSACSNFDTCPLDLVFSRLTGPLLSALGLSVVRSFVFIQFDSPKLSQNQRKHHTHTFTVFCSASPTLIFTERFSTHNAYWPLRWEKSQTIISPQIGEVGMPPSR